MNWDSMKKGLHKFAMTIQRNKYIQAISVGMSRTMPFMIVGALFTLTLSIGWEPYVEFLDSTFLGELLTLPTQFTTNIISIYVVYFIGHAMSESFGHDGPLGGLFSLFAFLIVTPLGVFEVGESMVEALPMEWLGSKGLFVAIIFGLIISRIYAYILDHNWIIKMPEGVPPTVEKSFSGLIPVFVIAFLAIAIRGVFMATDFENIHSCIYGIVQTPLESLGGTLPALIIMTLMISILWFFGIHGMAVVYNVMLPVLLSLDMQNLAAFQAGEVMPNIIGDAFIWNICLGGSGQTIGLVILMAFKSRSKQFSTLGKLSLVPGVFNINEPLIFGIPMVLNVKFVVPFILAPLTGGLFAYFVTAIGIVPPMNGVYLPLGVPMVIMGFFYGSWKIAALQLVLVIMSVAIYYPFFKKADEEKYQEEQAAIQTDTAATLANE